MKTIKLVIILALGIFAYGSSLAQKTPITQAEIETAIANGRNYTLVLLMAGPDRSQDSITVNQIMQGHLEHLFTMKRQGVMDIFGPLNDEDELKGMCIYNLTDKEAVRKLVEADPAVISGRLSYKLFSWFSLPGECLQGQ